MTRIAIAGSAGRMGRNLVLACSETDDIELTLALEREQSPALGSDSGMLAGIAGNGIAIVDHLDPRLSMFSSTSRTPAQPRTTSTFAVSTARKWSSAPPAATLNSKASWPMPEKQ